MDRQLIHFSVSSYFFGYLSHFFAQNILPIAWNVVNLHRAIRKTRRMGGQLPPVLITKQTASSVLLCSITFRTQVQCARLMSC